jgi:hypothetical protein
MKGKSMVMDEKAPKTLKTGEMNRQEDYFFLIFSVVAKLTVGKLRCQGLPNGQPACWRVSVLDS